MRDVATNGGLVDAAQLKVWLHPSGEAAISRTDLQFLLGTDSDAFPPLSLRSMQFVIAVLRDIYADDSGVLHWLTRERGALGGSSAIDLLIDGKIDEVETLLVRQWNQPRKPDGRRLTYVSKERITRNH